MDEHQHTVRLDRWGQSPATRVPDPEAAVQLIERVGVITHFPASPELPNLYHAYMGDPDAAMDSRHDSPAGHIYTWRWHLGRLRPGFYTAIVRKRPTWVHWDLLPAVLRLRGELRTPDELFDLGVISDAAYRIASALEAAGGVLSTGDLRKAAGFPTGKEQRATYQKAVEELDTRLMLTKEFSTEDDEMHHALVMERYRDEITAADKLSLDEALDRLLATYLPNAVYALPVPLARHLGIDEATLRAGLDRCVEQGRAQRQGEDRSVRYVWTDPAP